MSRPTSCAAFGIAMTSVVPGAQRSEVGLDVYWIEVEGGAATLVSRPRGSRSL